MQCADQLDDWFNLRLTWYGYYKYMRLWDSVIHKFGPKAYVCDCLEMIKLNFDSFYKLSYWADEIWEYYM